MGRRIQKPQDLFRTENHGQPLFRAQVEILGNGTGLHWPELRLDLYVPSLLRNIYGTKRWMAQLGRRGGMVKSPGKRKASQTNGRKGTTSLA
ncbi:MAG: DUF2442 domain-containing protein [Bryobacteraceae bacterium]